MATESLLKEQDTDTDFSELSPKQSQKGLLLFQHTLRELTLFSGKNTTIEKLPREILDEIFRFYRLEALALTQGRPWEWHRLIHVCRTWRSIIFDSTHRLGLQLFCTNGTPVRDTLHCWPKLPIVMRYGVFPGPNPLAARDVDEIVAALQQPGRIRIIQLTVTIPLLEKLATILNPKSASLTQEFPDLEHLELTTQNKDGLILHDQFLGGAAPRLHTLRTTKIALPGLPQLLCSATNLVSLQLEAIPSTGYIPPEDFITSLSEMTRLRMFYVHFLSPTSRGSRPKLKESALPLRRVSLPSLKYFEFHGDCEYLERLSDGIDAPILKYIYLTFFTDLDYPIPKLGGLIRRTETPSFGVEATVHCSATDISITFSQPDSPHCLGFRIPSTLFVLQMTSITEICDQLQRSATFSAVRQLDIYASPPFPDDHDDMDHTLFLDFFRLFGGVESLRVTKEIGSHIAHALVGSTVLPVMQDFCVEHNDFASVQITIAPFIAARSRSDHPVSLRLWKPINSSTVRSPPDGWIPHAGPNEEIPLPPPHELTRPIPDGPPHIVATPEEGNPTTSQPSTVRIPPDSWMLRAQGPDNEIFLPPPHDLMVPIPDGPYHIAATPEEGSPTTSQPSTVQIPPDNLIPRAGPEDEIFLPPTHELMQPFPDGLYDILATPEEGSPAIVPPPPIISSSSSSEDDAIASSIASSNDTLTTPPPSYRSFFQRNDPALALEENIRQTCERFSPRSFAICSLHQRAQSLLLSFMRTRRAKELEISIEVAQDLFEMHPKQMRPVKLLRMLAFCYALGSHEPGHRNKSVSMFEDAFQDESATTSERLTIAWWWATFARAWDHPSTTLAYRNTLSTLHSALTGAFAVQWNPSTTSRLGSKIHIPLDYASYQIEKGQLELAVETIEQGKTMIWSDIYGLRTSAGRLRMANPDLAERLATVSQDLAAVNASILAHRAEESLLDEEGDYEHMDTFSPMFKEQRRLLQEHQEIVAGIKALPGFENFMESIRFRTLQNAASHGPIIIINHCRWRCDILIVLHDSPPSLITTTGRFCARASTLASTLLEVRRKSAVESELFHRKLRSILKELYERVGRPVLDRLRNLGIPEQSRIWWYPTSVFCSLPLHAMGPVPSTDGRERYFSDLYVCSYTPTLSSLIAARTPAAPTPNRGPTLLFVGEPNEPSGSTRDMEVVRCIGLSTTSVFGNATREAVIEGLQKHRLAHFACRSHREKGKPFDTALELGSGDRIALLDIIRCRVPTTELAVLSTDRTAGLVDGTDFVEGLHLTAAMQYYGFGSVVGTMWDLGDVGGGDLFPNFYIYKEMLSRRAEDGTLPSERSAHALCYTVQKLREMGVAPQRWANWVHYGA